MKILLRALRWQLRANDRTERIRWIAFWWMVVVFVLGIAWIALQRS